MLKTIPVVLTFIFFLLFNLISLPIDLLIRTLQALSGNEE